MNRPQLMLEDIMVEEALKLLQEAAADKASIPGESAVEKINFLSEKSPVQLVDYLQTVAMTPELAKYISQSPQIMSAIKSVPGYGWEALKAMWGWLPFT